MPYVERDSDGVVKGCYVNPQPGYAEESLEDDAPEVIAFWERVEEIMNVNKGSAPE